MTTVLLFLLSATVLLAQEARPTPFFDAREHKTEYVGPGRELAEPEDVPEVRLAYFGPADPDHPEWGEAWRGASLAVDEANASGGYGGRPFRLLAAWSESPWGSGVSDLAKLVYREGVWAIVGGVDGVTTHLAEQIVVKARLAVVSAGNTDPSVHLTNVPWAFSLAPTDDASAAVLADAVLDAAGGEGAWAAVSATDHDSHTTWSELTRALSSRKVPAPRLHVDVPAGTAGVAGVAADLVRSRPRCVAVIARSGDAARLVQALRQAGFDGAIVGGATLGRKSFARQAGDAAEGVLFPLLFEPQGSGTRFARDYRRRFGQEPDWLAAHAYDATRLVVAAVRRAGCNRVRIQDALRALVPWDGATGSITWDATGRRPRDVRLGTMRFSRVVRADPR